MVFRSPLWLLLLLALPAVLIGYRYAWSARRRRAETFAEPGLLRGIFAGPRRGLMHLPALLVGVALIAAIVGAAAPSVEIPTSRGTSTVVVVLDASNSMRRSDVAPTRLDAARDAARAFVTDLPDDVRIGVVAFSAESSVLHPPTADHAAAATALDNLATARGTAIGDGVGLGLGLASDESGQSADDNDQPTARLVVLSDGRNTIGTPVPEAAEAAASAGVPVDTIAFGQDGGQTLTDLARTSGGSSYQAGTDTELTAAYERIGRNERATTRHRIVTDVLLGIGFLLTLAAAALTIRWHRRLSV